MSARQRKSADARRECEECSRASETEAVIGTLAPAADMAPFAHTLARLLVTLAIEDYERAEKERAEHEDAESPAGGARRTDRSPADPDQ